MKIVLVMLYNFQKYIKYNIKQLKKLKCNDIIVLTDERFIEHFKDLDVNIVSVNDLDKNYVKNYNEQKNKFKGGFWHATSFRFNILHTYMKINNLKNIIHIENDVLLYENPDKINWNENEKILITMQKKNMCVPGIMFIPNEDILINVIKKFNKFFNGAINDMASFGEAYHNTELLDTLPIFPSDIIDLKEENFLTKNYSKYNYIFDAAAIGQLLGGRYYLDEKKIDNKPFITKDCNIPYKNYNFVWKKIDNMKKPFLVIKNKEYKIFNLHIHSKTLQKFM